MDFATKGYPDNYSVDVLKVINALSIGKELTIVGSSAIRSQLYAGDYDIMEKVEAKGFEEKLKGVIKALRAIPECYLGDIKIGEVPEWNVFLPSARYEDGKVLDFNVTQSKAKVAELLKQNVISGKEAKEAGMLLDDVSDPISFLTARKEIRFHILRWRPIDVLNGFLDFRHHKFTLEQAVHSGGLIKIDAICNIKDRFTEFSVIYNVYDGKKLITKRPTNIVSSLREDVIFYSETDPFKSLKRFFALAKYERAEKAAEILVPILNSDLGRLYQIINDMKVLDSVLLSKPSAHAENSVRSQIDEVKARMGNIYKLKDFLSNEHAIIGEIEALLKSPKSVIERKLVHIIDKLQVILDRDTRKQFDVVEKQVEKLLVNK